MYDSDEIYHKLSKKAKRVVPDGFHSTWSPDGTELAYSRGALGFAGIEILNLKSEKTRLLTVPGFDPAWSPNRHYNYIVFNRDRNKLLLTEFTTERESKHPSRWQREIWLIKADGTEDPRFLARGYWPCWSSDSKRIFYHSIADKMLYSISIEDGARPMPVISCPDSYPTLSPDDKYVACRGRESRIVELSTNSVVTSCRMPPIAGGGMINWSPDGRELCIGGSGLWIYDLDTKKVSNILGGLFGWCNWSRSDTRQLAIEIESLYGSHREIWVAELDPDMSTIESLGPGRTIEEHCWEEASYITRLLNIDPEDRENYLWRAACYLYLQEYEKADADFKELAKLLSDNTSGLAPWVGRFVDDLTEWGIAKYGSGEYEQALMTLTGVGMFRSVVVNPEPSPDEVAIIAKSHHQLGQEKEAESTLEELRRMFENDKNREYLKWLYGTERVFAEKNSSIRHIWECMELGKLNDAWQLVLFLETLQE
jgi:hypothetical protein